MSVKLLFSKERALYLEKEKVLVLGDLHIGFEYELFRSGISIPSQTRKILEKIRKLVRWFSPEKLLLLGDVKHSVPVPSLQEKYELPEFLESIAKYAQIIITKGNHDGDIEKYCPSSVKIFPGEGVLLKNFAFAHGHAWIGKELLKAHYLFLAHEHASIEFVDRFGMRFAEPCWIVAKVFAKRFEEKYNSGCNLKKAVIFPAFNTLLGGSKINSPEYSPLGPNIKFLDLENARIYLVDGTYLGRLKNLFL